MSHKVIILDVAKPDFRDIRKHVKKDFGNIVWEEVNQEFKDRLVEIGKNPNSGRQIDELVELGITSFRFRMVRQTKIIYETTDTEVIVHMFIHTKRDFRAHLLTRLLNI